MPVPQVPRRAAPPRKKSSQKQTPPAETEAIASSLEKTSIHDGSETFSESQSAPVPVLGDVEPEVKATDPAGDVHAFDLADKKLESTEQSFGVGVPPVLSPEAVSAPAPPRSTSPRLDPQPDRLDNPEVDPSPTQAPYDTAEALSPTVSRITQEETEVEEVAVPYAGDDEALVAAEEEDEDDTGRREIAERVAKLGGFDPLGEHPTRSLGEEPYISSGVIPVESHSAAPAVSSEAIPYSVFQQGGGATAVNEEDDGNDGKY
jgi:myosin tail region-interacting protein MTI1